VRYELNFCILNRINPVFKGPNTIQRSSISRSTTSRRWSGGIESNFLTSALEEGGCSQFHAPNALPLRKVSGTLLIGDRLGSLPVWTLWRQRRIEPRFLSHPARSGTQIVLDMKSTRLKGIIAHKTVTQSVTWEPQISYPMRKESGHNSSPIFAKVKNTWIYTSTPPIRLHGAVLNYLRTRTSFPFYLIGITQSV
jgi:hypothetical protein